MKMIVMLTVLGASGSLAAQSLPDCRMPNLSIGTQCTFQGTTLPIQRIIGDVSLPSSEQVRMTEPVPSATAMNTIALRSSGRLYGTSVGAVYTVQSETFNYATHVSDGFKVFATKQWSDWRGIDVRATFIESGAIGVGFLPGNNHTAAGAAGPRIQHSFGPVTPYGEILIGALHQYYYGMSEGAVAGVSIKVSKHFSLVPADVEYRYASFQSSTPTENPRRGRIELSTGFRYHFGGRGM